MPLLDLLTNIALEMAVVAVQECACATQRLGTASAVDVGLRRGAVVGIGAEDDGLASTVEEFAH